VEKMNIILVGFMGTGKTTVGKLLASRLGMTFVDMDEVIEQRQKKKISSIFADDGEPFFRNLGKELSAELSGKRGLVIGTGGGIVLNPDNITNFSRTGLVVCLTAEPEIILRRLEHDNQRPLLEGDDKMKKIRGILEKRAHLYAAIPCQVDTSSISAMQVTDIIADIYRRRFIN